ncbi:hypothetical protein GCM10010390_48700 [Streptomyces mordarskii]|uniref:Uncharacterized protein n=1 Tax=Streptomyces mordarskii TaxID=1226758 RepID=A0ABN1DDS9_9ACTN
MPTVPPASWNDCLSARPRGRSWARLCEWYQPSIEWEYPSGPSPWTEEQWALFRQQADAALEALHRELSDGWIVEDRRDGP